MRGEGVRVHTPRREEKEKKKTIHINQNA